MPPTSSRSSPASGPELGDARVELTAAVERAERCGRSGRARTDPAAIAWLDYDAPDTLQQAMHSGAAHDAADPLARFVAGLDATHTGAAAHESLVGYSYGSTVVGLAAARPAPAG